MFQRLLHKINHIRIGTRIALSYALVVLIVFSISFISILLIQHVNRLDTAIREKYSPLVSGLVGFQFLMEETGKLSAELSKQDNESKRLELLQIQEKEYVGQKLKLIGICQEPGLEEMKTNILGIDKNFQAIMFAENELIKLPVGNGSNLREGNELLEFIQKEINKQKQLIGDLIKEADKKYKEELALKQANLQQLSNILVLMVFLTVILAILFIYLNQITLLKPIRELKHILEEAGAGRFGALSGQNSRMDELGDLFTATNKIIGGLKAKEQVVQAIGKGDFGIRVPLLSKHDRLGKALAEMRDQLKITRPNEVEIITPLKETSIQKNGNEVQHPVNICSEEDVKKLLNEIQQLTKWIKEKSNADSEISKQFLNESLNEIEIQLQSLLQFYRAGKTSENQEILPTRQLIFGILENMELPQNISILVDDQIPDLRGNKNDLKEIFQVFILNALARSKTKEPVINIAFKTLGDCVEFCIADKGPLLPPDLHDKIFNQIGSVENSENIKLSGAGLAIAKKIIEAYGGKVRIESAYDNGAKFYFTWPF